MKTTFDRALLQAMPAVRIREVIEQIPHDDGVVDCGAALHRLGGDVELLRDLVGFFFQDAPPLLSTMRDAVGTGDAEAVFRAAHRLKGLIGNFDAQHAVAAAARLESMGRQSQLRDGVAALDSLEQEIGRMSDRLGAFCRPRD